MIHSRSFLTSIILFAVLFFYLSFDIKAADNSQIFTFEKERLHISEVSGFDFVQYEQMEMALETGAPQLPVKIVQLLLPPGTEISEISFISRESEEIEGKYNLFPSQPPQVLSNPNVQFIEPDFNYYSITSAYPANIGKISSQGSLAGYNIASVILYPVQYFPSAKKLIFHKRIQIDYGLKESMKSNLLSSVSQVGKMELQQSIKKVIDNTSLLKQYSPEKVNQLIIEHLYVIITSDNLKADFQALVDWKTKKGLSAKIVSISEIYSSYPGIDNQEKIRNFIKDAYQNWGTLWILLGGDSQIIPDRKAFAMDCEYGSYNDNYIPCDLYYSDLDGDWNANGNNIYGEITDNVDMYPDVFVGRAPVENSVEAQAFVNKILTYEKNPPNGHELDMLFLGEILWQNPYTNSGLGKDHIDSLYVPGRFDPITKLYEALGNENYTTVMNALNAGQNLVNHDGHAWYTVMGIGNGLLTRSDMDMLTNGPQYSTLFSIGCWPAAFDYDCIAEHFITNPNGGGVAFIGNSRYGWGSPGNPLFGYSDRFDQQFFKKLLTDNVSTIGNALAMAKAVYIPFSAQENVYRWCEYEINLLGDPEMPVWTDIPKSMVVNCPLELPGGNTQCDISITDGQIPIENARVCLMQDTTVYETGLTAQNGQISFNFQNTDPSNDIHLTVTAPNFIPYETTISVVSNKPYVKISNYSTNGSELGYIIPGDLISMDICIKNFGNQPSNNVWAALRNINSEITVIDSTEIIGLIQAGDSVIISNAFAFQTSSNIVNGEVIYLNVGISDSDGNNWDDLLSITGATPLLTYFEDVIFDSLNGDNDGFAEPGETVDVNLIVKNEGLLFAESVTVNLSVSTNDLTILNPILDFGNISPLSLKSEFTEIQIDAGCPTPSFPQIDILFQTQDGYQFSDSFLISIGEFGIWDDMENGEINWTHSGTTDLWHLSSNRKNSGGKSWYCGVEGSFVYQNYMENELESIPVVIGQNPELSFWCWYDFPNYGTDGFYVEVKNGSNWETLDFIGSGGALLNTGNDWLEYVYDLSHYPPGTSLNLRFRFVSDGVDVAEGVYIDDVKIHSGKPKIVVDVSPPNDNLISEFQLHQNYPNPFNPTTNIRFQIADFGFVELIIYDVLGREITTLVSKKLKPGNYEFDWDGRNELGVKASSGVYFYRLQTGQYVEAKKMILMR